MLKLFKTRSCNFGKKNIISSNLNKRNVTSSADIRASFIDFYKKKQHVHVPSSKVFLADDKNINFVCAGMNQFKPIFLGERSADHKRVVNSQRCIRAGGKHNDLDAVGYDYTHHTFFEMLGSWSFNDYFKSEACEMAWNLLTDVYHLPKDRLYVTYFGGSKKLGLLPDNETKQIWLDIGVPENRVIPFGTGDNFWDMGTTGPCGPCTEIHYDKVGGGRHVPQMVNVDGSDVVEIWNLVFMQYNRLESQRVSKLPTHNVDTGMGLERISAVLQGKNSNYDTDAFSNIMDTLQKVCGCEHYSGQLSKPSDIAYRIVSDHIRMLTVAIADGLVPSSTGSGLILRKILRRAVLAGKSNLNAPDNFLKHLVPVVVEYLKPTYEGIQEIEENIIKHVSEAEGVYNDMVSTNDVLIDKQISEMTVDQTEFPFKLARKLYYHHGYPLERFVRKVEEKGKTLDTEKLEALHYESENYQSKNRGVKVDKFAVSTLLSDLDVEKTQLVDDCEVVDVKPLCFCNSKGEKLTSLQGDDIYLVLDKTFSMYKQTALDNHLGNLTSINRTHAEVVRIIEVDGWILHKLNVGESFDLGSFPTLKLDMSGIEWRPFVRAKEACEKIIEVLKDSRFNEHEVIKYKNKKDEASIELSGVVKDDTVAKVLDIYHKRNPDTKITCTRSKKSAKGQTTLTFISGDKFEGSLVTIQQLLRQFNSIRTEGESFKSVKKQVGKLNYSLEPAEISIFDKQVMQKDIKMMLSKAKESKKKAKAI